MGFLSDGLSWLAGELVEHASVAVTYSRGAYTATLNMVPGLPAELRATLGVGGRVRLDMEWVDFHFLPADLVLNGVQVEATRGDRITIGSIVREVSPPSGQPASGRSDVFDSMALVHTMRVT